MIGIFDSGIGGLGIFQEVKKILPHEPIIYLADSVNCPYGEKSDREIKKISLANTKFLIKKGCNIVVIACNTGSTIALEYVRSKNLHLSHYTSEVESPRCKNKVHIVGVVPVVKTAAGVSKNRRIGILATKKTVESKYLRNLVNKFCPKEKGYKIYYQAANALVELVENCCDCHPERNEGSFNLSSSSRKVAVATASTSGIQKDSGQARMTLLDSRFHGNDIIKKYLNKFIKAKVDVIALGCTHFPFLRKEIEEIMGPKVKILDSNGAVARQVARIATSDKVTSNKEKNPPKSLIANRQSLKYQFYTSGDIEKVKPVMGKLLGEKIILSSF